MRVGAFIVGGDKENQTHQRTAITEYFLSTAATIDYFPEKPGNEKLDAEDRVMLMKCARFCRKHQATFAIASLSGMFDKRWKALGWFAYQVEQYGIEIVVTDEPRVNGSSIAIISGQAEEQRIRLAAKSKAALDEIKSLLKQGRPVRTRSGKIIESLGLHDNQEEAVRLGNEAQARLARERDLEVWGLVESYLKQGMNMSEIARQMNAAEVPTPSKRRKENRETKGIWYPQTVKNLLKRQGVIK